MTDAIGDALNFDSLHEAEKLTGKSYKEDESTVGLGMFLHIQHSDMKKQLLSAAGDTYYNMDFEDAFTIYLDLDFDVVFHGMFQGTSYHESGVSPLDHQIILWHPDGILAYLDSYGSKVNQSKIYYNIKPHKDADFFKHTSSGHGTREGELVWIGDHDAREGLRYKLSNLRKEGEFLPVWVERPFLWLINHTESSDNYKAINDQRVAEFPQHVQEAVTPKRIE